ncbi:CMRF35-like molecule 1 isoform X2 [Tamandua tetradactyla]|uniref:CMRF35-like molecule 1 isoform X2 n=1 Tax=Tamandua tetradactyla TaxID=48850 RepID=UPI00405387E4
MYLLLLPFLLGLSGGFPIHGPKKKSGPERGSVTLQCHYDPGWETYRKWWCRGADWDTCKILIKTTGSEQEVKEHHISIRDNQEKRVFTVTMTDVSKKDADTYWCGIERIGSDLGFQVEVTIDSAASEETTSSSTLTSPRSSGRHGIWDLSILLPLIIAVFLLLLVAASLLIWRILKQQKKAAGISSEQVRGSPRSGWGDQAALFPLSSFPISWEHRAESICPGLAPWGERGGVVEGGDLGGAGRQPWKPRSRGNWERDPGKQRGQCPLRQRNRYLQGILAFPLPGAPAPGGRALLCKPDPAADATFQGILPDEGLCEVRLCPGWPGGGGICHYGLLPEGGHFLRRSVFGRLGARPNLQQHGRPDSPRSHEAPRGAHRVQRHQEGIACAPDLPPTPHPGCGSHVPAPSAFCPQHLTGTHWRLNPLPDPARIISNSGSGLGPRLRGLLTVRAGVSPPVFFSHQLGWELEGCSGAAVGK